MPGKPKSLNPEQKLQRAMDKETKVPCMFNNSLIIIFILELKSSIKYKHHVIE
jgi:hypothetical protein